MQFIGASQLPKMDIVGTADPYFVANIDKRISFVYVSLLHRIPIQKNWLKSA